MADTTIKKVNARRSPKGEMGQKYLVSGKTVSMRLWQAEPKAGKAPTRRESETERRRSTTSRGADGAPGGARFMAGAEGAEHSYEILEPFTAVEATAPPARVQGRDQA